MESPEHKARRKALRNLETQVIRLRKIELEPAELERVNIRALPMSLDDPLSIKPCFFDPYRARPLSDPDPVRIERDFPDYDRPIDEDWVLSPIDGARAIEHYLGAYSVYCRRNVERNNTLLRRLWTCEEYI